MTAAIIFGVRLVAASQVLLTLLLVLRADLPRRTRQIGGLLLLGVIAYLLIPLAAVYLPGYLLGVLELLANLIPALLLLLAWDMFEDAAWPPLWMSVLVAVYTLSMAVRWLGADLVDGQGLFLWLAQTAKVVLIGTALWLTWRGRADDLVEQRLHFRTYFCGVVGGAAAVVVLAEGASQFAVPLWIELCGMVVVCVLAFAANLRFQKEPIKLPQSVPVFHRAESQRVAAEEPVVQRLQVLMQEQRLYSDHDLKIGALAVMVELPEHRLRKAINGVMGFRNFNQYVNSYRIAEAAARLLAESHTPVLSIALDVGFRSISAFNAAFRQIHGCAPTTYRENGGSPPT